MQKIENYLISSYEEKELNLSKIKFEEKIVQISRVTKVTTGGKKLTFRAIVIVGDNKRRVGIGCGRAEDVNLAIDKAILNAKKHLVIIPLTLHDSIPHFIDYTYGACKIRLLPAFPGTGIIAGGSTRTVLELAGIKNILAKQLGSSNPLNNAKATILALIKLTENVEIKKFQSYSNYLFYNKILKNF